MLIEITVRILHEAMGYTKS